eukprot:10304788-Ditylum_brightwellii.AAC.1
MENRGKQSKINKLITFNTQAEVMKKTVNKFIKEQGEIAVDYETNFNTAVRIKWVMKEKSEKFII